MTKLSELKRAITTADLLGEEDPEVTGIAYDSRAVQPGYLFVAVRGFKVDGHRFLADAKSRGAAAAVVEEPSALEGGLPALLVPSAREAMPNLAAAFYGYPSRKLQLVGVTGTNGKTTTTYLMEAIANHAGKKTGVIGTIGTRIAGEKVETEHTTPESPDLQAVFARMVDAGVSVAAMEVSSHALALHRTLGCEFDVAIFTNLTQDHLDFHPDMEDYFQAKARLFTEYPRATEKPFTGVINIDDEYGRRLVEMTAGEVLTYAIDREADLRATNVQATPGGLTFTVIDAEGEHPMRLRIGGRFNVYNSLAAMGAARALGLDWATITAALEAATGVPGRFEAVDAGQEFSVLVDYAHTPDGLENVLRAARALNPNRLITVFGCGGDRDRRKRPIMGGLAAQYADCVVVTSDNPRTEDPDFIIGQILEGIPDREKVTVEPDRRAAIQAAIGLAEAGDIVLIAGKGHEDYQIFADRTVHFDDREEAREALRARLSR